MMRSSNSHNSLYKECLKFEGYVYRFSMKYKLFGEGGLWVGVSGGIDSMALLELCCRLSETRGTPWPKALHFNHGLREQSEAEELGVKKWCRERGVEIVTGRPDSPLPKTNLEFHARKARLKFFSVNVRRPDVLFLGHHLDDSYEWWLRQQGRSSSVSSFGIPVINGVKRRPFMCMSKRQVILYGRGRALPFWEDNSNNELKLERSRLRGIIIPRIKKEFPQYLEHYVRRQNELVSLLGPEFLRSRPLESGEVFFFQRPLKLRRFLDCLNSLQSSAKRQGRGRQTSQIIGLSNKTNSGPLLLGQGVEAWNLGGRVILLKEASRLALDQAYAQKEFRFEKLDVETFRSMVDQSPQDYIWCFLDPASQSPGKSLLPLKKPHSFMQKATQSWIKGGLNVYVSFRLLTWWLRPQNRGRVLNIGRPLSGC